MCSSDLPKQSIYRFRRADIALYLAARHRFAGTDPVTLAENFRTVPTIVEWVNHVFTRVMPAHGDDGTEGDEARFVNGVTIEIDGGRITRIDIAPTSRPVADEVIDARGMVVMPGLVNTHCHAAMTLMRGAAEDVPVEKWFKIGRAHV